LGGKANAAAATTSTARSLGRPPVPAQTRLTLLGGFELVCDGLPVTLPMSAQRVIAFVATQDRPMQRAYVAGSLWLETSENRAHANLRSALWRLQRASRTLVETKGQQLRLSSSVSVDLTEAEGRFRQALDYADVAHLELDRFALEGDLLPDWYDDWIVPRRERFRQLRLRALDALCERLTDQGRLQEALDVGLAAVAGEPLRESAHRALVRVHLAEGNFCEAIRQYGLFKRLLHERLGIEPSGQIEQLIRAVAPVRVRSA
jgi:DNA-binding SARP family transcriptional activator